jgi:hypothetical protein
MHNWDLVLVSLSAILGGLIYAVAGWLDSGEPFNGRAFGRSALAAVIAGIGFAVGYIFIDGFGIRDVMLAFLAGAGVTAVVPKGVSAVTKAK